MRKFINSATATVTRIYYIKSNTNIASQTQQKGTWPGKICDVLRQICHEMVQMWLYLTVK